MAMPDEARGRERNRGDAGLPNSAVSLDEQAAKLKEAVSVFTLSETA